MKQAITNLNKQESATLTKILQDFYADEKISARAQKNYRQLRKIYTSHHDTTFKVENLMKASLIIAGKSQVMSNCLGEKVRGVGLSINQIIKSCQNLKEIASAIKIYLSQCKVNDENVAHDLLHLAKQLDFGNKYVKNFDRALQYFNFQAKIQTNHLYKNTFRSFAWLLFIEMHNNCHLKDELQIDYLLISVLYLVVRYTFDYMKPLSLAHLYQHADKLSKKEISALLKKLFEVFQIDEVEKFKKMANICDDYFCYLLENSVICGSSDKSLDFFSPQLINLNYKKLDSRYQRSRTFEMIDQRLFLNNRNLTLTPSKYTNVEKSKSCKKRASFLKGKKGEQKLTSHIILDYEQEFTENVQPQNNYKRSSKQLKLPPNVKVSPSYANTPLICANGIHNKMNAQMENYIIKKINKNKRKSEEEVANPEQVIQLIEQIYFPFSKNNKNQIRPMTIFNFFKALSSQFFQKIFFEGLQRNSYQLTLLAVSIEICQYINNIQQYSSPSKEKNFSSFEQIFNSIQINATHLWISIKLITQNDKTMPLRLKRHMQGLGKSIFNRLLWSYDYSVDYLTDLLHKNSDANQLQDDFLRNLMIHIEEKLRRLIRDTGKQPDLEQAIFNDVYNTLKYIILYVPQTLSQKYIDQIILCSLYSSYKKHKIDIKFNQIIKSYFDRNAQFSYQNLKKIIHNIQIQDQSQTLDIIAFYKQYFMHACLSWQNQIRVIQFQNYHQVCLRNYLSAQEEENKIKIIRKSTSCSQIQSFKSLQKKTVKQLHHFNLKTQQSQTTTAKELCFRQGKKTFAKNLQFQNEPLKMIHQNGKQQIIRNQTAIRTRPSFNVIKGLCETEKMKINHLKTDR